jgi:hypothetical protein
MTSNTKTGVVKVAHHPAQHIAARYPYAAFGSNLLLKQIADRCKQCDIINRGELPGFRLDFARVATISADEASVVPVGVYKLSPTDIEKLDTFEGHNRVYDRFLVTPVLANGERVRCFTYIKRDAALQPPMPHYFDKVRDGYRDWNLDTRPLVEARERAEAEWERTRPEREAKAKSQATQYEFDYTKWDPVSSYGAYGFQNDSPRKRPSRKERRRNKCEVASLDDYRRTALANMPVTVPRYLTASHHEVEWGQKEGDIFWRIKGERVWYRDVSSHEDIQSGLVRGEFEPRLPGAQAYKPMKGAQ